VRIDRYGVAQSDAGADHRILADMNVVADFHSATQSSSRVHSCSAVDTSMKAWEQRQERIVRTRHDHARSSVSRGVGELRHDQHNTGI
jgi:hypothetical protein